MRIHQLETEQWLPRPLEEVFAFFSDAHRLADLTPPSLHFQILTPRPIVMQTGTLIDYRLKVLGCVPLRWQSEITVWEPPHRFRDVQQRGPYRQWIHDHFFEEQRGGTLVRDHVAYAVPGWLAEPLLHRWFVGPDLQKIFAYRRQKLQEYFPGS